MITRLRLLSLVIAALAFLQVSKAENLDGSTQAVGNAEAVRLYSEAEAYVSNMSEGEYSYDYLQFYWKRAQSNVDRIRRVYPTSPTARALDRGDLRLGSYSLDYFKNNVLYNLELKRLASFDDVNCAIFLYGRNESRNDSRRDAALASIAEVLARRQRWEEALRFPVLPAHHRLLIRSIYKIAAYYGASDIKRRIRSDVNPSEWRSDGFDELDAEGIALQGRPRAELYEYVSRHPVDEVRDAALKGVVEREMIIRRFERSRVSFRDTIQTTHLPVMNTSLRDKIPQVAARLYGANIDRAEPILEMYAASQGRAPSPEASAEAQSAYLDFLYQEGRMDSLASYVRDNDLRGPTRRDAELKVIEILGEAGERSEAKAAREAFASEFPNDGDEAALAEFEGRIRSTTDKFEAHRDSFADLPISDPCVLAVAIMDWSLSPTRSQRGATPWDAVVTRFAGGFLDLPRPKSAAVGDASSTVKPY
ncbi:MAG TPA: hypothetical protein VGG34_12660 [Opitutaceae bacterium]|jgi:hypothetical protein